MGQGGKVPEPTDFQDVFGRPPTVAWWAPGRVTLIGDHTDYSEGLALPVALHLGTTAYAAPREDGILAVASTQEGASPGSTPWSALSPNAASWTAYVEGVAWVLADEGVPLRGAEVLVHGDVPLGAGLSSSASLICSTMAALLELAGQVWDARRVTLAARRVENEYVGAPVGLMDHLVAMEAKPGHALFVDLRTLATEHVPLPLAEVGLALLVIDSGSGHRTTSDGYAQRVRECREASRLLGVATLRDVTDVDLRRIDDPVLKSRARHVVSENDRVRQTVALLRAGRIREVGPVMLASHASLRDDFAVSTPALDRVVASAVTAGALGARLTGAGFGGCAVVLTEQQTSAEVATAVRSAAAAQGFGPPRIWSAVVSGGAHSAFW
jgi:galactokinase